MTDPGPDLAAGVAAVLRAALAELDVSFEEELPGAFAVTLPGEHKLATVCLLRIGAHRLSVRAFVIRRPDENAPAVHRWLLERNAGSSYLAFAVDHLGDVYLTGALPLAAVTVQEVDRLLGTVLRQVDESFDVLLAMGFATAIRREWAWRESRGESTANLHAFRHLAAAPEEA